MQLIYTFKQGCQLCQAILPSLQWIIVLLLPQLLSRGVGARLHKSKSAHVRDQRKLTPANTLLLLLTK